MNSFLKVTKRGADHFEHPIKLFHFLHQNSGKGWQQAIVCLELFFLTKITVQNLWQLIQKLLHLCKYDFIRGHASSSRGDSRLDRKHSGDCVVRLLLLVANICIFVESKHLRAILNG